MKMSLRKSPKLSPQQDQLPQRIMKYVLPVVFMLIFAIPVFAQNTIRVKGRVTNETNQPVARASVTVKETSTGVTADDNGNFDITAPANGTLVISAINYATQEVNINNQSSLTITLNTSARTESEVIVVGYGTQRKSDVTGSVVSVGEKALKEVPVANLTQALTGRAAGVDIARTSTRPGQAGSIRVRGNRSLGRNSTENEAQNSPLLVVDGIPYSGNINDLNTDDIASVDILKDASATAIYGSRGSNGVIIVTTKRGSRSGKPVLSVNSYNGISEVIDKWPMMNAEEFAQYRIDADYSGGNTADEQAGLANGTNTDWQDLVYQKGFITNNSLGITGGDANTQYGLSGGYYRETGVFDFMSFERYSLRTTIDQKIGKRIKIGLNSMNTLTYNNGSGLNPMYAILRLAPMLSPYLPDGTLNYLPATGSVDQPFYTNPLLLEGNEDIMKNQARRLRTFNSLYGEVEIIKGLKYRINLGLDYSQGKTGSFNGAGSFFNATSIKDQQGTLDPLINNASIVNSEEWRYLIDNLLIYENTFAQRHRVTFTGLFSNEVNQFSSSDFRATGLPANYLQEFNFNQAQSTTIGPATFTKRGLLSLMGRVNYSYDDRYLLTATVRRDGSSVLSPGNQWFTYPALAVGWNVSNEQFMSGVDFVSNLKLRLGWGTTSNQSVAPYSTLGGLTTNFYNYGSSNVTGYYVTVLPNTKLKWESTSNTNIGIDFGLFRNRLTGSIDVYTQKTKDILFNKTLPISNGATSFTTNASKTKGHGVEISLSSINMQTQSGFSWATDLNFSVAREEIVELGGDPALKQDIANGWFVGYPTTVIYDFKKIGIWQTSEVTEAATYNSKPGRIKLADLNKDNVINADDRMIIGDYQPDWVAGMTNRFNYKDFDLSFVAFARWGNNVVNELFQGASGGGPYGFFGQGRANVIKYDYWTPANPTNAFPQPDGRTNNQDYYSTLGYQDGTFIKIRSITAGYTLPSRLCEKMGIGSLRIYLQAQNPFIIYSPLVKDGHGIDPEGNLLDNTVGLASQGGGTAVPSRAVTVNVDTPPTRAWILGINLKL